MHFQSDEIKLLGLSAPIILKMLRSREERILKQLLGDFRAGKTDFLSRVTEFVTVREQINELTTVLSTQET